MKVTIDSKRRFDAFLERRVTQWRTQGAEGSGLSIHAFLFMTRSEYGAWHLGRLDDASYARLIKYWGQS